MLYLSLALILTGLMVVIYVVSGELMRGSGNKKNDRDRVVGDEKGAFHDTGRNVSEAEEESFDEDIHFHSAESSDQKIEDDNVLRKDATITVLDVQDVTKQTGRYQPEEGDDPEEELSSTDRESEEQGPEGSGDIAIGDVEGVLFEDYSDIIDYTVHTGSIDPSLEEYKKIKRIGNGRLTAEKMGLSFFRDQSLYRFDYNKISSLKRGDNYLALHLDGSDHMKLFIIKNNPQYLASIEREYKEYTEAMG